MSRLEHEELEAHPAPEAEPVPNSLAAEGTSLLYERHRQRIFVFCLSRLGNRQEADDAVQNTFLYAFASLSRGIVPENELAWLYAIARNVCRTRQRSLWRRRRVEASVDLDTIGERVGRADESNEELIGLDEALAAMPTRQQQALLLREWQGLSYDEIGATLAVSQAAVETLLFRARRTLARRLEQAADGVALAFNGPFLLRLVRKLTQASPAAKTATALVAVSVGAGSGLPALMHERPHRPAPPARSTSVSSPQPSVPKARTLGFPSSHPPTRALLGAATQPRPRAAAHPQRQIAETARPGQTDTPTGAGPIVDPTPKAGVPQPVAGAASPAPADPGRSSTPQPPAVHPTQQLPRLPELPQLPPPKLPAVPVDPKDPAGTVSTAAQTVTKTVEQATQTVEQTVDQAPLPPLPPLPGVLPTDGTPTLPGP
jgi:RNA polymerase sigma-70 factor (ECF subfamily)